MKSLPERYRRASNIHEGYEIRTTEGAWLPVKHVLRIYAPANIVRFTFDDGEAFVAVPTEEVMSRRASS